MLQITLESNDFDQPGFAKDRPEEAAKAMRRFSLDSYRDTGTDSAGHLLRPQSRYRFIDGQPWQPSYDTIATASGICSSTLRVDSCGIASGQLLAMASRNNLPFPWRVFAPGRRIPGNL